MTPKNRTENNTGKKYVKNRLIVNLYGYGGRTSFCEHGLEFHRTGTILDELKSYQNFEDPLVEAKVKLFLCTTRRHMKAEEVRLHSFLTSALKRVSCPIYVLRIASTVAAAECGRALSWSIRTPLDSKFMRLL